MTGTMDDADAADGLEDLLALLNGQWATQAICTAAMLELPRLVADGVCGADALAAATSTHAASLMRLLRFLVSLGVFTQDESGGFSLTRMGALLDPRAAHSLHAWALLCRERWPRRDQLLESVRTGEPHAAGERGIDNFSVLPSDPKAAAVFHLAMVEVTRRVAAQLIQAVSFLGSETVADVGGGSGELAIALLDAYPQMQGIVFDLEHARSGAQSRFVDARVTGRCRFVAGSFFESVPPNADVYLLKSVLHNWDDDRASRILALCRASMGTAARLLIVERVLPQRWSRSSRHRSAGASDLRMLVGLSGRERTALEFEALLAAVGLKVRGVVPTAGEFHVIEAAAS